MATPMTSRVISSSVRYTIHIARRLFHRLHIGIFWRVFSSGIFVYSTYVNVYVFLLRTCNVTLEYVHTTYSFSGGFSRLLGLSLSVSLWTLNDSYKLVVWWKIAHAIVRNYSSWIVCRLSCRYPSSCISGRARLDEKNFSPLPCQDGNRLPGKEDDRFGF